MATVCRNLASGYDDMISTEEVAHKDKQVSFLLSHHHVQQERDDHRDFARVPPGHTNASLRNTWVQATRKLPWLSPSLLCNPMYDEREDAHRACTPTSQCFPLFARTLWQTGPGTSSGHEEKQETRARQESRGTSRTSPSSLPPRSLPLVATKPEKINTQSGQ